ncbi:unnamed protein product, partial [Anisakis simplex]|uniref:Transposase n=1 Tax=Anisakis simplex TaxID=6269 RepID=A0A0M3KJ36_ANISI
MLMSVVDLGKLMLISNKKDFSIYDSTKRPESLKYPESFKASLVQAASAERKAFDSANRTVRIIGNDARRIPVIFRNVFRIIENP